MVRSAVLTQPLLLTSFFDPGLSASDIASDLLYSIRDMGPPSCGFTPSTFSSALGLFIADLRITTQICFSPTPPTLRLKDDVLGLFTPQSPYLSAMVSDVYKASSKFCFEAIAAQAASLNLQNPILAQSVCGHNVAPLIADEALLRAAVLSKINHQFPLPAVCEPIYLTLDNYVYKVAQFVFEQKAFTSFCDAYVDYPDESEPNVFLSDLQVPVLAVAGAALAFVVLGALVVKSSLAVHRLLDAVSTVQPISSSPPSPTPTPTPTVNPPPHSSQPVLTERVVVDELGRPRRLLMSVVEP